MTFTELHYWDEKKGKAQERKDEIVSEDITFIDRALKTGDMSEIRIIHKKLDAKYQDIIKFWGKGMNEYSFEKGFDYSKLKTESMKENLHMMRSKLEAFKEGWLEISAKEDSELYLINAVKKR